MEVRWGRILFVVGFFLLVVAVLWLRHNADAIDDAWDSFAGELSDIVGNETLQGFTYLALALGVILAVVWVLSRVVRWFRG